MKTKHEFLLPFRVKNPQTNVIVGVSFSCKMNTTNEILHINYITTVPFGHATSIRHFSQTTFFKVAV